MAPATTVQLVVLCGASDLTGVAAILEESVLPDLATACAARYDATLEVYARWPGSQEIMEFYPLLEDPDVLVLVVVQDEISPLDRHLIWFMDGNRFGEPAEDRQRLSHVILLMRDRDVEPESGSATASTLETLSKRGARFLSYRDHPSREDLLNDCLQWLDDMIVGLTPSRSVTHVPYPGVEAPGLRDTLERPGSEKLVAVDENVQFTVYRPSSVRPEMWYPMLAFAHLAERRPGSPEDARDPRELVAALAAQTLGDQASAYEGPHVEARGGVPKESELTFVPCVDGIAFNPRSQSFEWHEDVHQENFRLRAGPQSVGKVLRGRMTVYLGAFILADVDLRFSIDAAAAPAPSPQPASATFMVGAIARPQSSRPNANDIEAATASPYRKVFPSYSHLDLEIVRQAEKYGRALGDVYLRDRTTLRSGEDWSERLLELIDDADIFQLFWSSHSMVSPYVQREWEHALSMKREGFIRPTYWEHPMPASSIPKLPPAELGRLHFHAFTEEVLLFLRAGAHRIPLSAGRYLIGRAFNSDIRLDDIHVSRTHAALDVRDGGVWLEDLGSSGGTLVNSEQLTKPRAIHSGDRITLGTVDLWLQGGDDDSATSTTPAVANPPVRYDVGSQSAGMINNVGRDQHLSYVQHIQQQRASFAREIAATKTKARWFIWLGIATTVLGIAAFGRMVLRFMQAVYDSFLTGQEPDLGSIFGEKILGLSSGLFGFAVGGVGALMIIIGVILRITATARRRRMERQLPLPPPWAGSIATKDLR